MIDAIAAQFLLPALVATIGKESTLLLAFRTHLHHIFFFSLVFLPFSYLFFKYYKPRSKKIF